MSENNSESTYVFSADAVSEAATALRLSITSDLGQVLPAETAEQVLEVLNALEFVARRGRQWFELAEVRGQQLEQINDKLKEIIARAHSGD